MGTQHARSVDATDMMSLRLRLMFVCLTLALLPGCAWWRSWAKAPQAPMAFRGPPDLAQIAEHINQNPVRQLEAERARISLDGFPSLTARLAIERPRNLRFRVETGLTGPELDVGSNPEMFWMWAKRNQSVFFARHDEFAGSAARQFVPIQPDWISEALGLMYFDPAGPHEGPFERGNNRLEVKSKIFAPDGELTRVMIVNSVYGWILEQHLYDPRGQLIASAKTSQHRYYPVEEVSLPHRIEIQLPPAKLSFALDVSQFRINSLSSSAEQLFAMPAFEGSQMVNVADPRFSASTGSSQGTVGQMHQRTEGGALPRVRGLGGLR
jgi:hypothetical protein